jgi:hypothetical protein
MKLMLHIGTHKTATTTIQHVLAGNRRSLLKLGVWYPAYSEVLPGVPDHYAHLDVAKGLMYDARAFTPETVATFFARLRERSAKMSKLDTVLISAEPFYRGRMPGGSSYWESRRQYISNLRDTITFDDVEVVLVLRRQDEYLESLYNEHVKTTRYSKDIWSFLTDYRSRFEYKRQIRLWAEYFPTLNVYVYEDLVKSGNVTQAFLEVVLGLRDVVLGDMAKEANVSLPVDLVEFKRFLNRTSLSRAKLRAVVNALELVAAARTGQEQLRLVRRLSEEDCWNILDEFRGDNEWINNTFFGGRSEGLFPTEIRSRSVMPHLSSESCAGIFAEMLTTKAIRMEQGRDAT